MPNDPAFRVHVDGVATLRLIDPRPPALSGMSGDLRRIEESGRYSNFGPVSKALERAFETRLFGGGHCVAVSNATTGLMLALRDAAEARPGRRYALMPSFTFAATAHAALWAGLTPLLCDVDAETWLASEEAERALLARHGDEVAAIVPCATFGHPVDGGRYERLAARHGCAVVLDAAAALGTGEAGRQASAPGCGVGVFSMHVTKAFATFEGGLIHTAQPSLARRLRSMANFGFEDAREAVMPGLNAKLSEVACLVGLAQLEQLASVVAHRDRLAGVYRAGLDGFACQPATGQRRAHMFMPVLLPRAWAGLREEVRAALLAQGIETGTYYAPHLAEQRWFRARCRFGALPVADDVAARVLCLPMHDRMEAVDVGRVVRALRSACPAA